MKNKLILAFSLLWFTVTFSQENSQSFTLQEAIDFALEHNRTAKNASLDIQSAIKQKWETTTIGFPQISAGIDYQNNIERQFGAVDFDGDGVPEFGAKQTVTASARATQLLFDGSYLVGLQSAKVFLEISKNAKEKTDLEVRKAIINAYGNVLLAESSSEILERNVEVLTKNLNELTKIYENGLEEEESVEQLQITLSEIKSNLSNVNRLKDLAYQMLNITMGRDIDADLKLSDSLELLTVQNISLGLLNDTYDITNSVDYKIAENDKKSKELLVKLEKSEFLPTLSTFINANYLGFNEKFRFLDSDQVWVPTAAFGVSLKIPVFNFLGQKAATQRAKINLEKSKEDLTEIEQRLKLQIASAKSDYQYAIEDYDNKKKNLNLAERIEQKNQTKFFEGIASSFDLRQAQTQLYSSQQEFLQAMLDVINKKAELETVLNTINN
ncbi:transporter [Algibacter marinivivus]|uniref:Transporter n=1 Tax=Algibacter marinivivus TaxID=2100723 RepID=A0A2U2X8Q9_9FLAO|nr:TolC family protein [Algibacter marinivivus]PWH84151.1 transporter [Algibacter marinivivus]